MSQRMGKPIWATGLKYPNPPWNGPSLSLGALDFDLYQPLMHRNWFIAALLHLYAFICIYMHLWRHSCWKYVGTYSTQFYKSMMDSGLSPGFMKTYPSPPENKSGCGLWIHGVLKFHCFEMLFRKRSIRNSKWVDSFPITCSHSFCILLRLVLQCCQHYHLLLPGPTHADNSESAACGQVKLVWSEIDSIFSFRRKGWSFINPGAIPACALKIIKFMLGFTATRWYKKMCM